MSKLSEEEMRRLLAQPSITQEELFATADQRQAAFEAEQRASQPHVRKSADNTGAVRRTNELTDAQRQRRWNTWCDARIAAALAIERKFMAEAVGLEIGELLKQEREDAKRE